MDPNSFKTPKLIGFGDYGLTVVLHLCNSKPVRGRSCKGVGNWGPIWNTQPRPTPPWSTLTFP